MSHYIVHSGIIGMRWGIRRFQNKDGSLTAEGKERYGKDAHPQKRQKKEKPESATWKSKDAQYLSDAELNRRNSRLQREQQYRQMTQSKGKKAAKWIAATASTILVATAIEALKGNMKGTYNKVLKKYGPKAVSAISKASTKALSSIVKPNLSNLRG